MNAPDPRQVRRAALEISRDDFFWFVWRVFDTLHHGPNDRFEPAWHVQAMCNELNDVCTGQNKRLVINIPPRCLKSVTVTVAVANVAYILGHRSLV